MHSIFLTRLPASHVFGFEIHVAGRWLQSFPDEDGWRGMMQWLHRYRNSSEVCNINDDDNNNNNNNNVWFIESNSNNHHSNSNDSMCCSWLMPSCHLVTHTGHLSFFFFVYTWWPASSNGTTRPPSWNLTISFSFLIFWS